MSDVNVALTLLGGLVLVLSPGAGLFHRNVRVVSDPMIALADARETCIELALGESRGHASVCVGT